MKKILTKLGLMASSLGILLSLSGVAQAAGTVVTPTNMDGWAEDSTAPADVTFVNGPGTPPLGTGSAQFSVDSSGATDAELRTASYSGLALADLTELSYSTYVSSNNNEQAAYIILNVDYDNDGATDDLLFFEPVYQDSSFCGNDQGDVVLNTWQDWDALNGCWWSVSGTAGAGPGTDVKTLSQILAVEPDAAIANSTDPKGAVRIVAGFGGPADWGNFVGNVDGFAINDDVYDFELTEPEPPVPTSKDECKKGGWQNFGDQFRNQGECVAFVASNGRSSH